MINVIKTIALLILLLAGQLTLGQTKKDEALSKAKEAIQLMDDGNIDQSITLLNEAQKLDPGRFDYSYELSLAYYLKGEYKETIKILEKLKNHKDVSDRLFQLLGNAYDVMGKSDKALEIYESGLKKFPNSGIIYLEEGNVYWGKKEYGKALPFYEKGIEVDPGFPSNYYRASLIYLSSKEKVWGMIYGEIFMNLERNSKRTAEISKLLFDTYKKSIRFTSDTSMTVSFCQEMTMDASMLEGDKIKLPYCMIFEPTLLMSVVQEKSIDINSLDNIRRRFIENYFNMGHNKDYPNILFEYENEIFKAGHMEAYNHWILMKGDEEGFENWELSNKEKWNEFVNWFTNNELKISDKSKFYKGQY